MNSTARLIASVLLAALIAAPCHAGLKEGLAAYDQQDYATALKELTPLAEKGDPQAQSKLGRMYSLGQGGPKDPRGAAEWFLKAAEQGVPEAQAMLGYMYLVGDGAPQNNGKAYDWTRKAADQGNAMAQYNLGVMHSAQFGIKKDPAESVKWTSKAAAQGHAEALNSLGTSYQNGAEGLKQDRVLAYTMFALAAARGSAEAAKSMGAIESSMSASQLRKAKELAAKWRSGKALPNDHRGSPPSPNVTR